MLVFGKALAASEDALGVDSVVVVRGRVDHKDADATCLIVQEAEEFQATHPRGSSPLRRIPGRSSRRRRPSASAYCGSASTPPACPPTVVDDLQATSWRTLPGDSEVVLEMRHSPAATSPFAPGRGLPGHPEPHRPARRAPTVLLGPAAEAATAAA